METIDIEINSVSVSDFNTRKDLDAGTEDTSIDDLADSIRERGLLSPIIVRMTADGHYDLTCFSAPQAGHGYDSCHHP